MDTHLENIKIECAENCRNSPRKELLKDLSISFVKKEIGFCMDWVTDDVVWELIGDKQIQGKNDFEKALHQIKNTEIQQLCIRNIITHGNAGSVNGTLILNNKQSIAFCDVYNFRGFSKNSKVKAITSYIIKTS